MKSVKKNRYKKKTMFQEIAGFLNNYVGKTVTKNKVLEYLFEKRYLVKNPDGSIYSGSFDYYRQKLRKAGFIKYDIQNGNIEVLKKMPGNIIASDY